MTPAPRGMVGPVPPGRAGLAIWSRGNGGWVDCALDEIVWLDRRLLSASEDQTMHRSPRCAGLRYVDHRWELFSRDPTYLVYVAPYCAGSPLSCEAVEGAAAYVLPVARAQHETLPVRLGDGVWLVSVGKWVLALRISTLVGNRDPSTDKQPVHRLVAAVRLVGAAPWLLPTVDRARFGEEWTGELWELAAAGAPRRAQLSYAARQLTRALPVRFALLAPRRRSATP